MSGGPRAPPAAVHSLPLDCAQAAGKPKSGVKSKAAAPGKKKAGKPAAGKKAPKKK